MLRTIAPSLLCKIEHLACGKVAGRTLGLTKFAWLLVAGIAIAAPPTGEKDSWDLRPAAQNGSYRRVRVQVTVAGKLKLNPDGQDLKHLPINVEAELQYSERVLVQGKQKSQFRLVRDYESAEAKIRLHESDLTSKLRAERRLVVVDATGADAVLFSPQGPLTREELELVEPPASKLALDTLLPENKVKLAGQWNLAETAVVRLLGLEALSQHEVVCTLESVKDNVALVALAGKVTGAVGGVSSDIELKGKLNFDLRQRAVTWLTLACKENRAIGHAQPGYEVVTTLRMVVATSRPAAELSDQVLARLPLQADRHQTLLELTVEGAGFQVSHDRRWSVMLDRSDLTVLRLIDRGDLVAQCNISPQPPLRKDEQLTLEGFQEDVKRALGKNFEQIVEANEGTGESGLRELRAVVSGKAGELPIQWTYYHVSDDQGHRAALVFTIEASLLERFAHIDRELVGSFRFLPDKQPQPAGEERSVQSQLPARSVVR